MLDEKSIEKISKKLFKKINKLVLPDISLFNIYLGDSYLRDYFTIEDHENFKNKPQSEKDKLYKKLHQLYTIGLPESYYKDFLSHVKSFCDINQIEHVYNIKFDTMRKIVEDRSNTKLVYERYPIIKYKDKYCVIILQSRGCIGNLPANIIRFNHTMVRL